MTSIDSVVGRGLRLLLRFRVPESKLEPTYRRIIDAVRAEGHDGGTDLGQLGERVRQKMNEIAPRTLRQISRGSSIPSPKVVSALGQCAGIEREIVKRRYAEGQSIEEIADSLQVSEDRVRHALNGVRRMIIPILK